MKIDVINRVDLAQISELLADSRFTDQGYTFDHDRKHFSLALWLPSESDAKKTNFLGVWRKTMPWRKSILSFENVLDIKIQQSEHVEYYEVASLDMDEDQVTLRILTHYAINMIIYIQGLSGQLIQTDEVRNDWQISSLCF